MLFSTQFVWFNRNGNANDEIVSSRPPEEPENIAVVVYSRFF